jgi:hypothetical protein
VDISFKKDSGSEQGLVSRPTPRREPLFPSHFTGDTVSGTPLSTHSTAPKLVQGLGPRERLRRAQQTLTGPRHSTGSVLANRLGLQLARIAAVNVPFRLRPRTVTADIRPYVEAYERDGVVLIEDFLPPDVFAQIREECREAHEAGLFKSECVEDNSILEESLVLKKPKQLPRTWEALAHHEWLLRLVAAITRLPPPEEIELEVSYMTKTPDAPDPKRLVGTNYLHADTHYPSAKAWLFLEDIDEQNGAFVYAKGTQKMTPAKLAYEYSAAVRVAMAERDGTMSVTIPATIVRAPTRRQRRGMKIAEVPYGGKANTLLVGNVGGFHKRGEFLEGRQRKQIMMKFADRPGAREKRRARAGT